MFIFCLAFSMSRFTSGVMLKRSFWGMARGTMGERTISILCLPTNMCQSHWEQNLKKTRDRSCVKQEINVHVFNYIINEKDDGWTFSWCMLIHEPTCTILPNDELGTKDSSNRASFSEPEKQKCPHSCPLDRRTPEGWRMKLWPKVPHPSSG